MYLFKIVPFLKCTFFILNLLYLLIEWSGGIFALITNSCG